MIKQKLNYASRNWPQALDKYEEQEKIMGKRRSFSKTDHDATFLRMKEDHMRNGQLKPAYNVQISTNNQYIASCSIHQQTTETTTLIEHVSNHIQQTGTKLANITADAGYGSEQNYQWLESKRIKAYVKHNQFDRQQNKNIASKKPYSPENLVYDEQQDQFICPMGKPMVNTGSYTRVTKAGYVQEYTRYEVESCKWCRLRQVCHGQKGNRVIEVNHNL
jgi:hypothetical protein